MKNFLELPQNYHESFKVDLQKDKKLAILINVLAAIIFIRVFVVGMFISPMSHFGIFSALMFILVNILYIVLHELIHGLFMRIFSGVRPHYGFTGLYAYAGSNVYFNRFHYIIIALAPVVIWGIVLALLCMLTNGTIWFWIFYLTEAMNLSGAAGDFYVTWRFSKLPKDILIQDTGVSMTVYTCE